MSDTVQVRLGTLARYAKTGKVASPIVGVPIEGRTLIVERRLLQAALDAPSINRAWANGDGRLHVQGPRAHYAIKLQDYGQARMAVWKWADSQRAKAARPATPITFSDRQERKARETILQLKRTLQREFGSGLYHQRVTGNWDYSAPTPPFNPFAGKTRGPAGLSEYERQELAAWHGERETRRALGRLVARYKAGAFEDRPNAKSWRRPNIAPEFYKAADAIIAPRKLTRESQLSQGRHKVTREEYLRHLYKYALQARKPYFRFEQTTLKNEAAEYLAKRAKWHEDLMRYESLIGLIRDNEAWIAEMREVSHD